MARKKRLLALLTGLFTGTLTIGIAGGLSHGFEKILADDKPSTLSCDYYFNNSDYKSIYEIVNDSSNLNKSVTTWGTVTLIFTQNNKINFYIQSTDRYGNAAAALVYQGNQTVAGTLTVGNVVTITGVYDVYNGCQEFKNASITVDYISNPSPVVPFEPLPSTFNSDYIESAKAYNEFYISITKGNITKENNNYYVELWEGGTAPIFVKNNLLGRSDITSRLNTYSMGLYGTFNAQINGILEYYSGSNKMQVQIFNVDDIQFCGGDDPEEDPILVEEVTINTHSFELTVGDTRQLTATVTPSNATNKTIHWNSNDTNVATVDNNGLVTAVGAGHTTITAEATDGSTMYDYCSVDVAEQTADILISSITLNKSSLELTKGDSYQMIATVSPSNATNQTLSWMTFDSDVVTIDQDGYITAVGEGSTWIYADATDGSYEYAGCSVTVVASHVYVESISISPTNETIEVGDQLQYTATILPSNATNKNVVWSTDHENIATIDENGVLTALAAGYTYVNVCSEEDSHIYVWTKITITEPSGGGSDYTTTTFNVSNTSVGSYSTGNYGEKYMNNTYITYYRVTQGMNLLPIPSTASTYGDGGIPGSVTNSTPIAGIKSITINYSTQYSSGIKPRLLYSSDLSLTSYVELPFSTSSTTQKVDLSGNPQFFRIQCGDAKMTLTSFTVEHDTSISETPVSYVNPYNGSNRQNPVRYTGTLVAGSSQVTVPYKGSTKTFTYYTEEYVEQNPSVKNDAAMIKPEDICAYVNAFGVWPANVQTSTSSVFGSLTRRLSNRYTRTDGYAQAVPYSVNSYYEIDIDIDGTYTTSNRGVGRVVVWLDGFSTSGYQGPVCVYTDDHYATFQEYANNGYFMPRFNGERIMTNYSRVA